jgi:hypothetical protein
MEVGRKVIQRQEAQLLFATSAVSAWLKAGRVNPQKLTRSIRTGACKHGD